MKTVAVFYTNRSEFGLLAPVISRLIDDPDILCVQYNMSDDEWNLDALLANAMKLISKDKPYLVIAPFDRVQMLLVAVAAMVNKVPVCQLHAGDISGPGTWDDKSRAAISMISSLTFCNGEKATRRVIDAKSALFPFENWDYWMRGKELNIYEVGSTALDDIEPDYNLLPSKAVVDEKGGRTEWVPFDLVLYNPETASKLSTDDENISKIVDLLTYKPNHHVVWIGPNGDPGSNLIKVRGKHNADTWHDSVPRAQYLGLLKKASRVIGNSSSFCVELPLLRDDWEDVLYLIGTRNTRDRIITDSRPGASDRIVEHIRRYLNE